MVSPKIASCSTAHRNRRILPEPPFRFDAAAETVLLSSTTAVLGGGLMAKAAGVQPGSAPLWDSAARAKAGAASAGVCASRAQAGSTPASREEAARIIAENDVAAFSRLRGVPGYQLEPVPWAKAVVLAREGTEAALGQLGRSPAALVVYHRFKLEVLCGPACLGFVHIARVCLVCCWLDHRLAALVPDHRLYRSVLPLCYPGGLQSALLPLAASAGGIQPRQAGGTLRPCWPRGLHGGREPQASMPFAESFVQKKFAWVDICVQLQQCPLV